MRIGYPRVSADQNSDLQDDPLQKAGCEKIFRHVASGAVDSRRGLAEAIEYAPEETGWSFPCKGKVHSQLTRRLTQH